MIILLFLTSLCTRTIIVETQELFYWTEGQFSAALSLKTMNELMDSFVKSLT